MPTIALRLVLLSALGMLAACSGTDRGEVPDPPAPGPAEAAGQAGDALPAGGWAVPFPADEWAEPSAQDAPPSRRIAGAEETVWDGAQTWRRGGETLDVSTQLILDPPAGELAWAMYQFSGMADGDSVTSVTIEVPSPGPPDYWLGWSDYNSGTWIWQRRGDKLTSTSVDDVFTPPAGVNPISMRGNVQVAVVAWGNAVRIYTVSLTAELNEVPVAVVYSDPSIGNQDLTVDFDASLSFVRGGGTITEYEWDWDGPVGGWDFESSGAVDTAQHTFSEPGTYQVVLRVTSDQSDQDLGAAWVTVSGWIHTWGGAGDDTGTAVAVDEHGSIYVACFEHSFSGGGGNVAVIKYDRAHNLLWRRAFGEEQYAHDEPRALAVANGSVYVAGTTAGFSTENNGVLLLRYSGGGTLEWALTWDGGDFDTGGGVAISEDDHIYVAGHTYSFGSEAQALLLKFDLDGNLVWSQSWGETGHEFVKGIALAGSDTIYIAGESRSFDNGAGDALLVKWNSSGVPVWARTWGSTAWEGANAITLDLPGNIYLAGGTATVAPGTAPNVLALKYSSAGELQWVRSWGTSGPDVARAAVAGGMIPGVLYIGGVVGWSTQFPVLLKFDTDGTLQWHRTWLAGSTDDDGFYGMALGPGGLLAVSGISEQAAGVWDDADPQTVVYDLLPAEAVSAAATPVSGTVTVHTEYLEESPAGTIDTGGGYGDALLLEYWPAEW